MKRWADPRARHLFHGRCGVHEWAWVLCRGSVCSAGCNIIQFDYHWGRNHGGSDLCHLWGRGAAHYAPDLVYDLFLCRRVYPRKPIPLGAAIRPRPAPCQYWEWHIDAGVSRRPNPWRPHRCGLGHPSRWRLERCNLADAGDVGVCFPVGIFWVSQIKFVI